MPLSRKLRLLILSLVLVCAAGCDQTSKHLARATLEHTGSIMLPGGFGEFRLAENPGSFLSLGDSLPNSLRFAIHTVAVTAGLLGLFTYLILSNRLNRHSFIGLTLILAGGTGNLIDRVARQGLVTDFIFLRVGPFHTGIFNLADLLIMIGMAVLLFDLWKRRRTAPPNPQ
jgi:signal peptidase II